MNRLIPFLRNHWLLVVALIVIIILLILEETKRHINGAQKLTPQQAVDLMNHQDALILDIRTAAEYQTGHMLTATNIPSADLAKELNKLTKSKNKPVIIVAKANPEIGAASKLLRQNGFTKLYFLSGGIAAWQRADLPLTKA